MKRLDRPPHVAKIENRRNGKVYTSYLLRRTYREGGKVKHETVGNLSHLPVPIIDLIDRTLKGETFVPASDALEILRTRPHGHVAAVLGTLRKIGLDRIIASRPSKRRDIALGMIVARVIDPQSKLATARGLSDETGFSSLGEVLDIAGVDTDDLYDTMDWLLTRQCRIENKLANRHLQNGILVLYDVSGSYYTGTHCELAKFGHPRDDKKRFPQIVYGLLCTSEGQPISIEVFEGNTSDSRTLSAQIRKIRRRFRLDRVVFVGDRGMITQARIEQELQPVEGLDWITALRAPAIKKLMEEGAIPMSFFDEHDLAEIVSPDYPDERLVVCRNPLLAEERARKRRELLQATERKLDEIVAATQRIKRPLRGKDKIALRVGREINRRKVGKHFKFEITDTSFTYERDTEKIEAEAALDGIYVIRTSVAAKQLDVDATVRAYKGLSVVERAFRCMKTVDLKVRPIHHRLANRVRSHVFLCMLAYYVEWHMRQALAPVLFDDEDKELAQDLRESVVAPAKRSPKARRKDATKRTEDGQPVHSFHTLLEDLATIAKNRCRFVGPSSVQNAEFDLFTTPTVVQRRALELLGVTLAVS